MPIVVCSWFFSYFVWPQWERSNFRFFHWLGVCRWWFLLRQGCIIEKGNIVEIAKVDLKENARGKLAISGRMNYYIFSVENVSVCLLLLISGTGVCLRFLTEKFSCMSLQHISRSILDSGHIVDCNARIHPTLIQQKPVKAIWAAPNFTAFENFQFCGICLCN